MQYFLLLGSCLRNKQTTYNLLIASHSHNHTHLTVTLTHISQHMTNSAQKLTFTSEGDMRGKHPHTEQDFVAWSTSGLVTEEVGWSRVAADADCCCAGWRPPTVGCKWSSTHAEWGFSGHFAPFFCQEILHQFFRVCRWGWGDDGSYSTLGVGGQGVQQKGAAPFAAGGHTCS